MNEAGLRTKQGSPITRAFLLSVRAISSIIFSRYYRA